MLNAYVQLGDNWTQYIAAVTVEANSWEDSAALCAAAGILWFAIADAKKDIEGVKKILTVNYPIGTKADTYLAEASYRIAAVKVNGCGMRPADSVFSTIKEAFAQKKIGQSVTGFDILFQVNRAQPISSYAQVSEAEALREFEENECGFNGIDCEGLKQVRIPKIERGDVDAIYEELNRAIQAYNEYYKIARPLSDEAEKVRDGITPQQIIR